MIVYGFTGTQRGMTAAQLRRVNDLLLANCKVRHGDCIGADAQFHGCALKLARQICIHPPISDAKRAFCAGYTAIKEPKDYLDRNKDIVNSCSILLATPGELDEQLRSGTWSTVRYARKQGTPVIVIYPDGIIGA